MSSCSSCGLGSRKLYFIQHFLSKHYQLHQCISRIKAPWHQWRRNGNRCVLGRWLYIFAAGFRHGWCNIQPCLYLIKIRLNQTGMQALWKSEKSRPCNSQQSGVTNVIVSGNPTFRWVFIDISLLKSHYYSQLPPLFICRSLYMSMFTYQNVQSIEWGYSQSSSSNSLQIPFFVEQEWNWW